MSKRKHKHKKKKHSMNVLGDWGGGLYDDYECCDIWGYDCYDCYDTPAASTKTTKTTKKVEKAVPLFKICPAELLQNKA